MSNALAEIRTQVQAALAAGVPAAKWADVYDGEDWNDEDFKTIRSRIAMKGAGIYVRLPTVQPDADGAAFDHVEVYIQLLCCAAAAADRETAAAAAEALAWSAYETLRDAGKVPAFMHCRWMLPQFGTEHQSANCTIVSLTMGSAVDLADLDESTSTPDTELPTLAKSPPVDADRLTLWDSAAGWARKYVAWSVVKSTLKTYFDGLYAGIVHAARHASAGADPVTPAAIGAAESGHDHDSDYDALGAAAAAQGNALTPAEYSPGALGSTYAVDWSASRQVQLLGTVSSALELTKGAGWPAAGNMAYVLLRLTISGTPTITWTVVDAWTSDAPAAAGTYLVHLRQVGGTVYASAEEVQ